MISLLIFMFRFLFFPFKVCFTAKKGSISFNFQLLFQYFVSALDIATSSNHVHSVKDLFSADVPLHFEYAPIFLWHFVFETGFCFLCRDLCICFWLWYKNSFYHVLKSFVSPRKNEIPFQKTKSCISFTFKTTSQKTVLLLKMHFCFQKYF